MQELGGVNLVVGMLVELYAPTEEAVAVIMVCNSGGARIAPSAVVYV